MLFIIKLKCLSDIIVKQKRIKTSYLQGILKNIVKKVFSFMGGEKHRGKQRLGITKTERSRKYMHILEIKLSLFRKIIINKLEKNLLKMSKSIFYKDIIQKYKCHIEDILKLYKTLVCTYLEKKL